MSFDRDTKVLSGIKTTPFYHPNLSIGEFLLHYLRRDPQRIIQTNHDDNKKMSGGEIANLGCIIAENLLKRLKGGDVVGIMNKNTTLLAPLVLGCLFAGMPVSTSDPTYSSKEIAHIFKQTKPKIVFCDHDNWNSVVEALTMCEITFDVMTVDENLPNVRSLSDLMVTQHGESEFIPQRLQTESSKVCAAILCSSGTTGLSKGVMLSHAQCIDAAKTGPIFSTLLCFSSLYWFTGFSALIKSLANNTNRVITKRNFSPELLVEIVEKHKVNVWVSPPSHVALLLQSSVIKNADLSSLRANILTGGQMDVSLRKAMQAYLPNGSVIMTYANTESGGVISTTIPFEEQSNSVGKVSANLKVKVIDDDGKTLNPHETGEICIIPPHKFLGYTGHRAEYEAAYDSEGWFKTGDLGYITEDGEIFYLDRKKEVFDYMNYQVFPSELESWIVKMEGVKSVCVVGIRDSVVGCLGAAVVVKKENSSITEQEIVDEVERNFIPFKWLHGGAYFVDSLPLTSSGKIKRVEVREIAEKFYAG